MNFSGATKLLLIIPLKTGVCHLGLSHMVRFCLLKVTDDVSWKDSLPGKLIDYKIKEEA